MVKTQAPQTEEEFREQIEELIQRAEANGVNVARRYRFRSRNGWSDFDPQEKELIREAVKGGYFKAPREMTLVELSERLDMSDTEVSKQLRRTLDRYLRSRLSEDEFP